MGTAARSGGLGCVRVGARTRVDSPVALAPGALIITYNPNWLAAMMMRSIQRIVSGK
jgi:hypothetical protein